MLHVAINQEMIYAVVVTRHDTHIARGRLPQLRPHDAHALDECLVNGVAALSLEVTGGGRVVLIPLQQRRPCLVVAALAVDGLGHLLVLGLHVRIVRVTDHFDRQHRQLARRYLPHWVAVIENGAEDLHRLGHLVQSHSDGWARCGRRLAHEDKISRLRHTFF